MLDYKKDVISIFEGLKNNGKTDYENFKTAKKQVLSMHSSTVMMFFLIASAIALSIITYHWMIDSSHLSTVAFAVGSLTVHGTMLTLSLFLMLQDHRVKNPYKIEE